MRAMTWLVGAAVLVSCTTRAVPDQRTYIDRHYVVFDLVTQAVESLDGHVILAIRQAERSPPVPGRHRRPRGLYRGPPRAPRGRDARPRQGARRPGAARPGRHRNNAPALLRPARRPRREPPARRNARDAPTGAVRWPDAGPLGASNTATVLNGRRVIPLWWHSRRRRRGSAAATWPPRRRLRHPPAAPAAPTRQEDPVVDEPHAASQGEVGTVVGAVETERLAELPGTVDQRPAIAPAAPGDDCRPRAPARRHAAAPPPAPPTSRVTTFAQWCIP